MHDYFVDGHYIFADTPEQAWQEVKRMYGHEAEEVRPWTQEDQAELDFQNHN